MKRPTIKDRFEYLGVIAFVRTMRLLPHAAAVRLGGVLGEIAFDVLRFRRSVTVANIEQHLGKGPGDAGAVALGRRAYAGFGMGLAEFARIPDTDLGFVKNNIETVGLDHLDRILKEGRGAVLVTGHFGSWELMGCALSRLGYPLTFVVGVQRNRLVQELMNRLRRDCGISIIEPTSLLAATRVLRDNRFIAMLSDQDAGRRGIFVDFMGEKASTPAGAARLAILTGAPLVTGFIMRLAPTRHRIVIEEPIYPDTSSGRDESVRKLTRAFTVAIESYVKRYPDHWLWAHRRWNSRPG
jgi:KDO2-lipid IV(A) lauroyltransferase